MILFTSIRERLVALALVGILTGAMFHFGTPASEAQVQFPNNARIVGSALGSGPTIPTTGLDTNIPLTIGPTKGSGNINVTPGLNGNVVVTTTGTGGITLTPGTGGLTIGDLKTDNFAFLSAIQHCSTDVPTSTAANLHPTRLAAGDFAYARTAAGAETYNLGCTIPLSPFRTTASKGVRIDSLIFVFQVTVVALTNHDTLTLNQVAYANNVANAVTAYGGALSATSFATATQANPYATTITPGTPAFLNTAAQLNLSWRVIMANTGVFRLYGIKVNYSTATF